jgi:hypothetical protein
MHMRRTTILLTPLMAALAIAVAAPVVASEKRPLPDVAVTASDGSRVPLPALGSDGAWLLIYVGTASTPSARLVAALKEWQGEVPEIGRRVVLLFPGPVDEARRFVEARGDDMPAVRWVVDADGTAAAALRVTGTPTIIGVADGRIEWVLSGVLNEPTTFQRAITGWVQPR